MYQVLFGMRVKSVSSKRFMYVKNRTEKLRYFDILIIKYMKIELILYVNS